MGPANIPPEHQRKTLPLAGRLRIAIHLSERYPLEKVVVEGKYEGAFIDNGAVQMLSWNQEGLSIMITASRPHSPYPVSTLLQIAVHLKRAK